MMTIKTRQAVCCLLIALMQAPTTAAPRVIQEPPITIFRDPARYVSFPDVKRLPDGRLLCIFRDAKYPARVTHIDADARIVGCNSTDAGRTWSKPTVIYDDPACQQDPSLAVLKGGRLAVNFFDWVGVSAATLATQPSPSARKVDRKGWGEYAEVGGVFVLWGRADPLTWEQHPVQVSGNRTLLRATSSSMIQTSRDVLLLPTYGSSDKPRKDEAYLLRSTDDGRTWQEIVMASSHGGRIQFQEPALVEMAPGRIICVMRTEGAEDHLYQVRSDDDGFTWNEPQRLVLIGHPADLHRLPDGRILIAYGYRHPPFGVHACVSADEGKSWDLSKEIAITDKGAHGDLGYPSICLADKSHVLVAYYMNGVNTQDRWIECKRIAIEELPR